MGGEGSGRHKDPVNVYTPTRVAIAGLGNTSQAQFELPNVSAVKEGDNLIQRQNVSGAGWVFNDADGKMYMGGTPPGGAGGNSFETIMTDSGSVVADSSTDTLTLNGGTGISTTGTAGTDTISIDIDSTVATLTGTQILTGKTIDLTDNTITGTLAEFNIALSDENFASIGG